MQNVFIGTECCWNSAFIAQGRFNVRAQGLQWSLLVFRIYIRKTYIDRSPKPQVVQILILMKMHTFSSNLHKMHAFSWKCKKMCAFSSNLHKMCTFSWKCKKMHTFSSNLHKMRTFSWECKKMCAFSSNLHKMQENAHISTENARKCAHFDERPLPARVIVSFIILFIFQRIQT